MQARVQKATCFVVSGVLHKVLLQDPHEDGGQKSSQQQHCHAGVDDAEPVDLHNAGVLSSGATQFSCLAAQGCKACACLRNGHSQQEHTAKRFCPSTQQLAVMSIFATH